MIFNFVKSQSVSIVITLATQSTNVIIYSGSLTQYTSESLLLDTGLQLTTLICIQTTTAGVYAWQEQTPISTLYKTIANLQVINNSLIGQIVALLVAPVNTYLICNGASYVVATYQLLFNVIGYKYGGSGLNFNVPDFRGLFLRGLGTNATNTNYVGSAIGTLQTDVIKNHNHSFTFSSGSHQVNIGVSDVTLVATSGLLNSVNTSDNGGSTTETRPANQSVIWCIKYV